MSAKPLEGVRVLDLSRLLPGPFASLVLADLGAQVDKVEDPGPGDYLRHMPPMAGEASVGYHALNRGKRSLVLDLKKPDGVATLRALLPTYDVVLEQFRPGVLDRLGLSHAQMREANPRLVVAAITGYGQTGPDALRAGHDLNYLARAGLLGFQGPEGGPPQPPGFQLADVTGGLYAVLGVLAALHDRDKPGGSGEGRVVDVSMTEAALGVGLLGFATALGGQAVTAGAELLTGGIAPYNTYATKDGKAVALGALEPKFWMAFAAAVGLVPSMEDLVPGPHQKARKAEVAAIFAGRTRDDWAAFARAHDVCLEPVLTPDEARADAQHAARGVFFDVGGVPQLATPLTPRGDARPTAPAAAAGAHTDAILKDAGLDDARIAALRASGAVR